MSIIVETGAGLPNAQSYMSTDEADIYHASRGLGLWENMTVPEKEMCLVRATDFLTQKYRLRWKGYRHTLSQRLDWPRNSVVIGDNVSVYASATLPYDNVPEEVKNACAELALRASISGLSEDLSPRVIQETIGPITIKYDTNSSPTVSYTQVGDILKPLLNSSGNSSMVKLSRC